MNETARPPTLVRLALAFAIAGVLVCLPLLIRETPYTFVVFMFLGQPLLALGFILFSISVIRDLKGGDVL
jgi:hypothetical protein